MDSAECIIYAFMHMYKNNKEKEAMNLRASKERRYMQATRVRKQKGNGAITF